MESNQSEVQLVGEPKVEARFGFAKENKILSKKVIQISIGVTVLALTTVMLIQSPDRQNGSLVSDVKTPETSDLTLNRSILDLETYSATQESERLKQRNQRKVFVVRLPGLQKIVRSRNIKIPPGSMVRATLVTGASNGTVKAQVSEPLQVQGETVIPEGSILLGMGQSIEERLFVRFSQLVLRDGTFETIQAQAADGKDKIAGLKGSRVGQYALKYGAAIGLNFVSGMSEGLQEKETVGQAVVTKTDTKNALLNGASRATLEMANETMTGLRNKAPIIEVEAGKEILVIFENGS